MKFRLYLLWHIMSFMRLVFLVFPFHGKEHRRRTAKKAGFRDDNMSFNKARCVFYQGLVGFNLRAFLAGPGVSFPKQSQSTVKSLGERRSEVMRSNHRLEEMSREQGSNASPTELAQSRISGQGGLSAK